MSYKNTVLPIIRRTREISLPSFGKASITDVKNEGHAADVVTEIDGKVERFLREELGKAYPEIKFVGEEEGGDRSAPMFWLCDPIDGTGHYTRGLNFCSTMLALIKDGEVIFSAIYDFVADEIYWAEKGKGAFINETPMHVSNRNLKQAYVCFEVRTLPGRNTYVLQELEKRTGTIRPIAAGWVFRMIACGKLDGAIMLEPWGLDYDFAPGTLLVTEAGGMVKNFNKDTYDYRDLNFYAGAPLTAQGLLDLYNEYKE